MARGPAARIVAGSARGRAIHTGQGERVRPTPSGVREALGNIFRDRLRDASVLDLFAGYGCLGLELLSRGAGQAVFVERDARAAELIRRNLGELLPAADATVVQGGVHTALEDLAAAGRQFDFLFADPPYDRGEAVKVLSQLSELPQLRAPGATVILQHSVKEQLPETAGDLVRVRERRSGNTMLSFYELQETR